MALRKQLVWGCVGLVWVFLRANEAFAQPAVEPSPHPRETGGSAAELGLTSERAGGRTGGERPEHELTSEEWSPPEDQPSTLHWDLLRLPETLTRLAVSPLIPLVRGAESVRLDRRIEDIVTNDEKTRLLLPVVIIADRDGVGFGVLYRHSDLFGESEKLEVQGLVKTNLDWSVDTSYSEEIAWLNGRRLGLSLEVELDKNERYYGIGNDTFSSDERALRQEQGSAELSFEVTGPGILALKSEMTARYLRQRLGAGTDPTLDPVGQPGDRVIVPAGFDQTADYVDVSWSFAHDTRDTEGRTHRGTLLQLDLQAAHDVNGLALGAAKTTTRGALFLPLAPRHRVLVFSVGTSVVTPWTAT